MGPMPDARALPEVVLVAHEVHDLGGMERVMAELIRRGQGSYRFTVVSIVLQEDLRYLADWVRIRVPRKPAPLRFSLFFLVAGLRLRSVRGSLKHTCGAIVPNAVDVTTVHFCHAGFRKATGGLAPADAPPLRRANTTLQRTLASLAEKWCYRPRQVRLVAAVSRGVGREVSEHFPRCEVVVTPNGVDLERFEPDAATRAEVRESEGVRDGETVGLLVGGDWDRKGLAYAIEGLGHAVRNGTDARLWVVGPGDQERFGQLARDAGVGDRVTFFGRRADTERYYLGADFFVLPTLYEAAPLVSYEAAAAGLPVIATRVSGVEDLVEHGTSGLFVERDAASVGAAIAEVAADPEWRRSMAAEGRKRAAEYTWDRSYDSVDALYRRLIGERVPA